ncbi:MAG: PSD1 and planctomycete cytochrome C domain-containing protein [Verrucomicrobiota bacterium]
MKSPLVVALLVFPFAAFADEPSEGEKLFALKVKPLFAEKCMACHGDDPEKIKGDFDMRTRASTLEGGDYFAEEVLIPEKGEESFLYVVTTRSEEDFEMPPKEADQLTEEQQWAIRDWINEGAPWPDDERVAAIQDKYAEGVQVATSKALSDDWQNRRYDPAHLWAYQPIKSANVPKNQHPVDFFIDRKLKELGLDPAPEANPRELTRRISFGLTGLPPYPKAVHEFETQFETNPAEAVSKFAQKLMDSPHYGEHFGRHWLDVVRYADTGGFANDYPRPNAWRYRDYVVRAFNDDKPFNDFTREQLAGDEIDPTDPTNLIATGFLRMGPWEQTGMSVPRVTRVQWLDDITDSVGQTFLAHALQCAKCHDHKFDPVPTRDYYKVMAAFSTTQFTERPAPFLPEENKTGFPEAQKWVKAKIAYYDRQKESLNKRVAAARKKETGEARTGDNGLDPGDEASLARMGKNVQRHSWELDKIKPIAFGVYSGKTIERTSITKAVPLPKNPWQQGTMEKDHILDGGDVYSRGDAVTPGALSAAQSLGNMAGVDFPAGRGARRLALADWIVDPSNPLTARVIVNRVWTWHFGKGLAGNPNNFGATGALPTHPELLDYLAQWFIDNNWSVKKLNELITSSETYRRSSRHPDPKSLAAKDPKNDYYASFRPRRLTAEELRDAMLTASGELNRQVGGLPSRPDINIEVALQPRQLMGGAASVYEPDPDPEQRNRRSLYAEKNRGLRDPFLESFNQPGPDKSCELRDTSTVAPQALTLFNAEEVLDRAVAFANRLLTEDDNRNDEAVINRAFQLALGRSATPAEVDACLTKWNNAIDDESKIQHEPKEFPKGINRTVMAEKTGEPYTFYEYMPAYNTYVPDLQRSDVDARTRGLAHVCVVIFNLNEFAYLD